jgi:WD40 repeat protein
MNTRKMIVVVALLLVASCPLGVRSDKAMPDITLSGHSDRVLDVAFSRDGKTLFVATTAQILESFDVASGEGKKLVEKTRPILSLEVSKDGKLLVTGGCDGALWLVAWPEGKLIAPAMNSEAWIKAAAIAPDGKWPAGGGMEGRFACGKFSDGIA